MEISHSVKPHELTVIYKEDIHLIKSSQQAQLFQERSSYTSVKSNSTIPKGIMGNNRWKFHVLARTEGKVVYKSHKQQIQDRPT